MRADASNSGWYAKQVLSEHLTCYWEPHVHPYFRANFFHLRGRNADLIIDSGMGIVPFRPVLDIAPGKPVIAVATHIHADHVGAFHEFETRLGHRDEERGFAEMADDDTVAHVFRMLPKAVAQPPYPGWALEDYSIPPAPLTAYLDEGDVVELGGRTIEVLHLPGHSHGSIGLLDRADGALFTGDVIYVGGLVDDLPCSDKMQYRKTMERLMRMDIRVAYGGHGEPMDPVRMRDIAARYLAARQG